MLRTGWRHLKRTEPCPVCGRGRHGNPNTHCTITSDGSVACCQKSGGVPHGGKRPFKRGERGGYVYRLIEGASYTYQPPAQVRHRPPAWNRLFSRWWAAVDEQGLRQFAATLGVSIESLRRLEIGWAESQWNDVKGYGVIVGTPTRCRLPGTWVFPGRSANGDICSGRVRTPHGAKYSIDQNGTNGDCIYIPRLLEHGCDLFATEGPTSTAAMLTLGFNAVGRLNNRCGIEPLRALCGRLRPRRLFIVGDNDKKDDGKWPGLDGAVETAKALAEFSSNVILPPDGMKDMRVWLQAGAVSSEVKRWIDGAIGHGWRSDGATR